VSTDKQNCFVICVQHFVFFTYRIKYRYILLGFKTAQFVINLTAQRDLST